jgi:hypothetical protein
MLTKEELLEKGVSSEVADEIIASHEDSKTDEDPLQALEKSISDPEMDTLFKANGEEGDSEDGGDDKDYDEVYMKKHMKKYMINNKKACKKMATDVGLFNEKMSKAIDDVDVEAEGAVIEMDDLKPVLESYKESGEAMVKAVELISDQLAFLSNQNEKSYDLMKKSGAVVVEQAKVINGFMSAPQGRKGKVATMSKATHENSDSSILNAEQSKLIYQTLMKATQGGDRKAGKIISVLESAGQDANMLDAEERKYVNDLITQEAK